MVTLISSPLRREVQHVRAVGPELGREGESMGFVNWYIFSKTKSRGAEVAQQGLEKWPSGKEHQLLTQKIWV